jgi:ABC-type uncharacterized transport system substrate-binding protein
LVALAPDIILAAGGRNLAVLQQADRTIPVVFVTISDPVSGGFVESLARPGGNATGFSLLEYSMSGKWLELPKEVAPRVIGRRLHRQVGGLRAPEDAIDVAGRVAVLVENIWSI